jgi:hypothetical protein
LHADNPADAYSPPDGVFLKQRDSIADRSITAHEMQHRVSHQEVTVVPNESGQGKSFGFNLWLAHIAGDPLAEGMAELATLDVLARTEGECYSTYADLALQTGMLISHAAEINGTEPVDLLRKIKHDDMFGTSTGVEELRETIGKDRMDAYLSQHIWADGAQIAHVTTEQLGLRGLAAAMETNDWTQKMRHLVDKGILHERVL